MDKGIWDSSTAAKKNELMKKSQSRAMMAANKIAEKLGMLGRGVGPPPPPPPPPPPTEDDPVKLIMPRLKFPDDEHPLRVNWDELVKGISVSANSIRSAPFNVRVSVELFIGEPQNGELHPKYDNIVNDDILLYANQEEEIIKDNIIPFKKEDFPYTGRYTLRATLTSMEPDETKGDPLDVVNKAIYLEEDPPQKGLFERTEAAIFQPPKEKVECKIKLGEHESYVFMYNREHPRCEKNADDPDTLYNYLLRLMIGQLAKIDMRAGDEKDCKIFEPDDFLELDTLLGREKIVAKTLDFIGEALFDSSEGK